LARREQVWLGSTKPVHCNSQTVSRNNRGELIIASNAHTSGAAAASPCTECGLATSRSLARPRAHPPALVHNPTVRNARTKCTTRERFILTVNWAGSTPGNRSVAESKVAGEPSNSPAGPRCKIPEHDARYCGE
jgi:hypothetical protein